MDLAELNVFLTVAQERSFSRAAQKLFRTQPAVSITIRKLEESLGQPLFVRGARPLIGNANTELSRAELNSVSLPCTNGDDDDSAIKCGT